MRRVILAWTLVMFTAAAATAQSNDFVTIAPEPSSYAWWLRAQFHPFETQVRGIPLRQLRSIWCKASEFRKDLFPPELVDDIGQNEASFSINGDFDGSKVRQTALVGVYETCSGERGSFLLILARPPGGSPAVRLLHEFPGEGFGAVAAGSRATVGVFHCMECDNVTRFKWSKAKKRFLRLPPEF
jgi:hypothetical protein